MATITLHYDHTDDEAAGKYLGILINRSGKSYHSWQAVFADDRIEQTLRALTTMEESARGQLARLRVTYDEKTESKAYLDAKARVTYFHECVLDRLRIARDLRADMRRRVTATQRAAQDRRSVNILAMLTEAVATHRATTEREFVPTTADRLLWARLDVLRLDDGTPISELIKRQSINPEPQPGDRVS
jgi:hypothetical protein